MLAAFRSFLTQDIDLRVLRARLAEYAATLANGSRTDLIIAEMEGPSITSLQWQEDGRRHTVPWQDFTRADAGDELRRLSRKRLVLLVVPEPDVISVDMPVRAHTRVSPRKLVALNFVALSPFPLDAVHLQCESARPDDRVVPANYVTKARVAPLLDTLAEHDLTCDGLLFGHHNSEPYLFDHETRIRKRFAAHAGTIGVLAVMLTAGLVLSATLSRFESGIAKAEQQLAERVTALRKLNPPGNRLLIDRARKDHFSNSQTSRATVFAASLLESEDALSGLSFEGTVLRMEAAPETLTRLQKRLELQSEVEIVETGPVTNGTGWLRLKPRVVPP